MQQRLFNPVQSFIPETKTLIADVAIVGGGTCATSDLCAILDDVDRRGLNGVTVSVFEKEDSLGAGIPWNKGQHPTLTANDPHRGMIMFSKNPDDFYNWLKLNLDKLKKDFPNLAYKLNTNTTGPDRFARRFIFGIYAEEKFQELLKRAYKCGNTVIAKPYTEIIAADLTDDGIWVLRSKDNQFFKAKNLKLAVGPLPPDTYTKLMGYPGYHHLALDEKELQTISRTDPIAIMGSGLTAICAAKILIENGHCGPIYFISSSGHLPRVKGRSDGATRKLRFLTSKNLEKKDLRLTEVLDLLVKEIRYASGKSVDHDGMMLTAREYGENPLLGLQNELKRITAGEVRPWWWIMGEIYFDVLPLIGRYLHDDDRETFMQQIMPLYLKWMAGMTEDNARRMVELMLSGQLQVLHGPNGLPKLNEGTQEWDIETRERSLKVNHVINATGPGRNIRLHPLLNDLLEKGHVRENKLGGLDVTRDELRLINKDGRPLKNGWASGQATVACNPASVGSIEWNARDAEERIGPQIGVNIVIDRRKNIVDEKLTRLRSGI